MSLGTLLPDSYRGRLAAHADPGDQGAMARVVIIEPHSAVHRLLELQVELLGHERVDARPHDVAIVEPADPGALAAARRLRREQPDLPLVFVSIRARTPETADLRPVAHLTKPVELADLRRALDDALDPNR